MTASSTDLAGNAPCAPLDREIAPCLPGGLEHFTAAYLWMEVANTLLDEIAAGKHSGRMPSREQIAADHDVSPATAARALREIALRGAAYRSGNLGYFTVPADGDEPFEPQPVIRVRKAVRARIASGALKPGDMVLIGPLCDEHGCGRGAVRKALAALEGKRLLDRIPGTGYIVTAETRAGEGG